MNNPSSVHHYIPIFYTKGFTDEDGFVYIYDKQTDRIHHKRRSPKSIFFEPYRNTGTVGGHSFDILETGYFKFLDDLSSELIGLLRSHMNPIELLDSNKLVQLKWFITNLFWRLPRNDNLYNRIYPSVGVRFGNNEQTLEQKELAQELKSVDLYKKLIRIDAPFKSFDIDNIPETILADLVRFNGGLFLLGDYPMVYRKEPNLFSDLHQEVIIPISADILLIIIHQKNHHIHDTNFITNLNLQIIHQAKNYVVSHNHQFLTEFVELYRMHRALDKPISGEIVFNNLYGVSN